MIEGILRVFKQLLLLDYRSFYFLVLGDFGDKIKKELMELTGNCCIMSLTVVFMIAQGKIKKFLTIFFFGFNLEGFLKQLQLNKVIIKRPQI